MVTGWRRSPPKSPTRSRCRPGRSSGGARSVSAVVDDQDSTAAARRTCTRPAERACARWSAPPGDAAKIVGVRLRAGRRRRPGTAAVRTARPDTRLGGAGRADGCCAGAVRVGLTSAGSARRGPRRRWQTWAGSGAGDQLSLGGSARRRQSRQRRDRQGVLAARHAPSSRRAIRRFRAASRRGAREPDVRAEAWVLLRPLARRSTRWLNSVLQPISGTSMAPAVSGLAGCWRPGPREPPAQAPHPRRGGSRVHPAVDATISGAADDGRRSRP